MSLPKSRRIPRRRGGELAAVWQDTRQIVMTAQIAAIYAAILIPFKAGIPIIPGFVELRPANAIPVVASLLFGPAAAWGSAIGNVIGDCFGTLGPASFFGFWGNFALGYLPHILWGRLGWLSSGSVPLVSSLRQGLEYVLVCILASAACAGIIAWGVQWLGLLPFQVLAPAIFFNNIVMGIFLGPPLLRFLYPRICRSKLRFEDIRTSVKDENACSAHPVETGRVTCKPVGKEQKEQISPILEFADVSFCYAGNAAPALCRVSLKIFPGELVMVLGKSGSGKTTLGHICNGLIPHFLHGTFSGEVRVNGRSTDRDPVWAQAGVVGVVFQDFDTQLIATTVEEEVRHPLEYRQPPLTNGEIVGRMAEALERVGLQIDLSRDPVTLSGGQRQRLVLASVLAQRPLLLMLDEPASDLDPAGFERLRTLLLQLKEEGIALLVTARDSDDIQYADRVLVLDRETVVWAGRPGELLQEPHLLREFGLEPLAITACFEGKGLEQLPISIEEAWTAIDALQLKLAPPDAVLHDHIRLGRVSGRSCSSAPKVLVAEGVSFGYGSQQVLYDLSFEIRSGEFLAILGANGSGKSTLSRLLNGLLLPNRGRILVNGLDSRTAPINELAKRVGLVFQNPDHQIFAETVWDEVAFGPQNFGCGAAGEVEDRVREALLSVGIPYETSRELDPFSLRKGERQRIAVASVLASRPGIIIFDEPTTGLDARETARMMEMIHGLHEDGHTIVMITHSMRLVAEYATRCLLINAGRFVADGHPREIFGQPGLVRTASLNLPVICQFSQKWGCTLLTEEEVRHSLLPTNRG